MSAEQFKSLVASLCDLYRLDPRAVLAGAPLTVRGVVFTLHYNGNDDEPSLLLHCDYGPLPLRPPHLAEALRALLQSNLLTYTGGGPGFSMTASGHVIFATNFPLAMLSPPLLAGVLVQTALQASAWRQQHRLPPFQETS